MKKLINSILTKFKIQKVSLNKEFYIAYTDILKNNHKGTVLCKKESTYISNNILDAAITDRHLLEKKIELWYKMYKGENFAKFFGLNEDIISKTTI